MVWHLGLLALSLVVLQTAQAQDATRQRPLGSFRPALDSLWHANPTPELAVAIVREGEPVSAEGFGGADVDEKVPVTPDTPFWVASVTKTFVGLTFLGLAEDGVVDLDAPMADLPGFGDFCGWLAGSSLPFARGLDCAGPITVRTLLTHTSNGDVGHAFLYNPLLYSRLPRYLEWAVHDSTGIEGGVNELARQVEARVLAPAGMTRTVATMWDRSKLTCSVRRSLGRRRDTPARAGSARRGQRAPRSARRLDEADAVLIVDPDGVLALAVHRRLGVTRSHARAAPLSGHQPRG